MEQQAFLFIFCHAAKCQHIMLRISTIDPLKTALSAVHFIKRRMALVHMEQGTHIIIQMTVAGFIIQ